MSIKHNNMLPNQHFRKHWQKRVRTWFDQPGRKLRRRKARSQKAEKLAPRPVELLRPVVRAPTSKYNRKLRLGRGFTFDELRAVGISRHYALTIGIPVDHRRRNRSLESLEQNVERLQLYLKYLIVLPRKGKKTKKSDACDFDKKYTQVSVDSVVPQPLAITQPESRIITDEEREFNAYAALRRALKEAKTVGKREMQKKKELEEQELKK
ncbi:unnamed protein product [Pneumocystis jirovecii]|uniref:60S ribosomal protein L13 n=2 Tax=Pneumocystis jirovecii TaxID=42068 RepID=L0PC96_PNEJI|nr:uncharacterized protein T551_02720 [Pneumocystis jirovecii RU7]KTW28301.1 hypothetical protein T551_02720 [Pneumocystis jirovecii RU7]CCJ29260.1 unnamed protein product [Pneumocystis jirovecii]